VAISGEPGAAARVWVHLTFIRRFLAPLEVSRQKHPPLADFFYPTFLQIIGFVASSIRGQA
jgi:hypothetical protein